MVGVRGLGMLAVLLQRVSSEATWWPAIPVALTERVTNARTEGFDRILKQVKRVGCGFTNHGSPRSIEESR